MALIWIDFLFADQKCCPGLRLGLNTFHLPVVDRSRTPKLPQQLGVAALAAGGQGVSNEGYPLQPLVWMRYTLCEPI